MTKEDILIALNNMFENSTTFVPESGVEEEYVDKGLLKQLYNDIKKDIEYRKHLEQIRVDKFLFVEDGSVDVDALEEALEGQHIKVVVYRQGSTPPVLKDVDYD